jgi:small subunit ribosomal protein S21
MTVRVRNNDVAQALKILKKKLDREHFISECKQREAFEKPGEKRRRKERLSKRRRVKAAKHAN